MLSVNAQPDTQTSKDTAISKLVIYNKTDKDKWDWIEKFLPSILALSAIGLSMYSINKQSKLSEEQLRTQIKVVQTGIDEKSIRKKIDDLIIKTETIMNQFFNLVEKTRLLGYSEEKLLAIAKKIFSTVGTLRLYIPVLNEDYKELASRANDLTNKTMEYYLTYIGPLEDTKKLEELKRINDELTIAETNLIDTLHTLIELERFKLTRLLADNAGNSSEDYDVPKEGENSSKDQTT
jgi:hypothetical protein